MPPKSPLKSVTRQRPPQATTFVSTALEVMGGAPGAIQASTVASQVPASCLKSSCSGPGLGIGGSAGACARTAGAAATVATRVRNSNRSGLIGGPPWISDKVRHYLLAVASVKTIDALLESVRRAKRSASSSGASVRRAKRSISCSGASVRRAQRSVSSIVSRRIHSDATRLMMSSAQRSAPHSDSEPGEQVELPEVVLRGPVEWLHPVDLEHREAEHVDPRDRPGASREVARASEDPRFGGAVPG